jgi:hypothetical protein
MFFIAAAGQALAHSVHAPHLFFRGVSALNGMSVIKVESLIRGPY